VLTRTAQAQFSVAGTLSTDEIEPSKVSASTGSTPPSLARNAAQIVANRGRRASPPLSRTSQPLRNHSHPHVSSSRLQPRSTQLEQLQTPRILRFARQFVKLAAPSTRHINDAAPISDRASGAHEVPSSNIDLLSMSLHRKNDFGPFPPNSVEPLFALNGLPPTSGAIPLSYVTRLTGKSPHAKSGMNCPCHGSKVLATTREHRP
jgi:hypothetical protein